MTRSDPPALRRAVLAVSVLHDLDLVPADDGVVLLGVPEVLVPWDECARALAGAQPGDEPAPERLRRWLQARRWAADLVADDLVERLRPVGLPVDHVLHPGLDWVQERVLGDALDLGLGAVGLDPTDPDAVVLLPAPALERAGVDGEAAWPSQCVRLERLGEVAVELLDRDRRGTLRPVGDADAVTLLGARSLRTALARPAGGMCSVVVPMRRRGWTRLGLTDPAFGAAAAAATCEVDRGFPRPLLVTADEVVLAAAGRPAEIVLRQPAAEAPAWGRDVLRG